MTKKVLIYAYLEGNLGDDLMVWILCNRYPKVHFQVTADKSYKKTFQNIKNLKVYSYDDIDVVLRERVLKVLKRGREDFFRRLVRKADALVHIGGSLYIQHDNYDTTFMLDYVLRDISKRMYVCGANFGPYKDESFYFNYYQLLAKYDGVCFRDRYSYELFETLPNASYGPDIVFNYKSLPSLRTEKEKKKKQVLISVIEMKNRDGAFPICKYAEDYCDFIVRITETYMNQGYQVKFISFCQSQGDPDAVSEIVSRISREKRAMIEEYVYQDNLEEALHFFDEVEIVIGTRFHSIILGWIKNKKVMPIVYDEKTLHTLEDNGVDFYVTLEQLKTANVDILAWQVPRLPEDIRKKLQEDAWKQFADLDDFLKDR